jgi:uncharacterized membrane protein
VGGAERATSVGAESNIETRRNVMTNTTPLELLVSAFPSEQGADEALATLLMAKQEHLVRIKAAATVRRDAKGKLQIKERGDIGTAGGAGGGAAVGAVAGLFGGPIGALLGAGAGGLIGGLSGKLIDSGIPNDRLQQLGEGLTPDSSAIVALIEHSWVDEVRSALVQAGGDIMTAAITADVAQQLADNRDVVFRAIEGSEGAIAAERVSVDDAAVQDVKAAVKQAQA